MTCLPLMPDFVLPLLFLVLYSATEACLSRSNGDMDVGVFVVLVPYVKQVKVFLPTVYDGWGYRVDQRIGLCSAEVALDCYLDMSMLQEQDHIVKYVEPDVVEELYEKGSAACFHRGLVLCDSLS
ncbi:hypothetical protein VNO78_28794 [Psophocarpus tetragonolobus]|uniref:Uncharacterized protein n=1 Tax=Psophocarpus tetragonolobus TaxID=3891 RepID=A0AAN9RU68_PSOTE